MKPLIVGHRGNARHAPENTRVSFIQAIKAGTTMVEMDTRLSRDGQIVLMHDETVDRTTGSCGRVCDLTVQQLQQLDAGSWKSPEYRGEPVPTLTQVADVCRDKAIMMLDLKCRGQGPALARWITDSHYKPDQIILAPWDLDEGIELHRHIPSAPLVLISETIPHDSGRWLEQLGGIGFTGLSIDHGVLTLEVVQATHRRQMKLYAWTVNDPVELRRLSSMRVDGVITDDPALAAKVLGA